MSKYIDKLDTIASNLIKILKAIFAIFKIDEPEFDLTGENYDAIKDGLTEIAGAFED
jgi:hypothetical protein